MTITFIELSDKSSFRVDCSYSVTHRGEYKAYAKEEFVTKIEFDEFGYAIIYFSGEPAKRKVYPPHMIVSYWIEEGPSISETT